MSATHGRQQAPSAGENKFFFLLYSITLRHRNETEENNNILSIYINVYNAYVRLSTDRFPSEGKKN
jgi:hypothetical protein